MTLSKFTILSTALLMMLGCSNEPEATDEPSQDQVEQQSTERDRPSHVLKTQMEQLDKAHEMKDQLNQSVIDRVNAIDKTAQTDDDEN